MMSVVTKKLNDGNEIPIIGLGTWQNEGKKCAKAVQMAIDIGYRHIDTAEAYFNQAAIKEGIKNFKREKLFITTKLWRDFMHPKSVEKRLDADLMELGLNYVDLFLIHWPDIDMPILEVYFEMTKLVEKGKIKSVGVCNFTAHHLQDFLDQKLPIALNQFEMHPFLYQKELISFCEAHGIAITAYCPLARKRVYKNETLQFLAEKHHKTPGQVALRWLVQKEIAVIPKASSYEHIKENFEIFDFKLAKEEMQHIDEIHEKESFRLINPDFAEFNY